MSEIEVKLEVELVDVLSYIETLSNYPKIDIFKQKIEKLVQTKYKNSKCYLHGSNASKLSLKNSDVDICVDIDKITWSEFSEVMIKIFEKNKFTNIKNIEAKTNLIKFYDPIEKLDCDLAFDSNFCVKKAEIINQYTKLNSKVRDLILLVKYFVKKRNIYQSTEGYPNSLCYSMMCLYFLQYSNIIPIFKHKMLKNEEIEYDFETIKENQSDQDISISNLFIGFMNFYAFQFDFENDCISVREGKNIPKKETEISKTNTPISINFVRLLIFFQVFCVEDPMILTENCCRSVTNHTLRYLRSEFNRCQDLLKKGKNFEFVCKIGKIKNDREKWRVE